MGITGWLKRKRDDPAAALREVLGAYELPSFPAVVLRALSALRSDRGSARQVAEELSSDPGITGKLLSLSNSAAIGLRQPVKNIEHAVSILGRRELEPFLLGVAVSGRLPSEAGPGFDASRFWAAAARRASVARALAGLAAPAERSECFTAALLSDMAIPLLAKVHPERYGPMLEAWHEGQADLYGCERESFGWTHAQVAGWMCETWQFPAALAGAIGDHHENHAESRAHTSLAIASGLRETDGPDAVSALAEEATDRLDLPRSRVEDEVGQAFEASSDLAGLFTR